MKHKGKKLRLGLPPQNIQSLVQSLNLAKGETAESSTLNALRNLRPQWFVSGRSSTKEEDRYGIDIFLSISMNSSEYQIPLQIKTSKFGLRKHIQQRKKIKGRFIPVAVIPPYFTEHQIVEEVRRSIKLYFSGKEKYRKIKLKEVKKKFPKK